MKRFFQIMVVLSFAILGIWSVRGGSPSCAVSHAVSAEPSPPQATALPKLVCLGAGKCIPCKQMEPVREALRTEYEGQLLVEYYDVWQNQEMGRQYGVRVIPTTIFFSADGRELYREEGFMSKDQILNKWKEFGVTFSDPTLQE